MAVNQAVQLARSHFGLRKSKRRAGKPTAVCSQGIGLGVNAYPDSSFYPGPRLHCLEGERLCRVAEVVAQALSTFGDQEAADRDWF